MVMEELTESTRDDLDAPQCRDIRSHYRKLEIRISEGKDEIGDASSKKFIDLVNEVENIHQYGLIVNEVENIHQYDVNKPREQVADAEALLGLTSILIASVKSSTAGAVTPAEFVSCLIRDFGQHKKRKVISDKVCNVLWRDIGSCVPPIFMNGSGCRTMIGPMDNKLKQRKRYVRAKRARSQKKTLPEELEGEVELVTDTDRNIHVMFEVLKKKKNVGLERLILNRSSFAQTIENLFALSFLVKDGRAHIGIDENGAHVVVPRNGPSAQQVITGVVKNHHFVFRLDFVDWKLMEKIVPNGEELMPQRSILEVKPCCTKSSDRDLDILEGIPIDSQFVRMAPPIVNKYSRKKYMTIPRTVTT